MGVGALCTGLACGCWAGVMAVYTSFRTRAISVCLVTDFEYRLEKPDWQSSSRLLFEEINQVFQGTGVRWRLISGGDAYPAEAKGNMVERAGLLDQASCPADVILGLTGRPDKDTNSVALPFSHTLLVRDTPASTPAMTLTAVAASLAELFGVPISTQGLVFSDAQGGILDAGAIRIIRTMRGYDFARGIGALSGSTERRSVKALAEGLVGRDAHPEAEAHRIIARAFAGARRYEDAIRHLSEAVQVDAQNAGLRFEYAMALESDARSDDAIAELKTAAKLDPTDAKPHAAMGVINLNRRRVDLAVEEFRAAARLDPHEASYQVALGQALSEQPGGIRDAAAAFEEAMRLKPAEPGAFAGLRREDTTEQTLLVAVREMEALVNQKPASAEAHMKLGLAHANAGDAEAARDEIQRALQLEPRNGPAHIVLARLDYLSGQYREAASELDAARAAGVQPGADLAEAIQRKLGGLEKP
ncbi:MAG TPA: tetratricopeptide repeat protein [Bryobacteraceae bacterium]|nr:tetratricopeptide repeat protein [Bryobacteraceae bacterium]